MRGPFNVSARGAGRRRRSAGGPRLHAARAARTTTAGCPGSRQQLRRPRASTRCCRASAISCWSRFPAIRRQCRRRGDAFLNDRGILPRASPPTACRSLPHHHRHRGGDAAVVAALAGFMKSTSPRKRSAANAGAPLFERVVIVGHRPDRLVARARAIASSGLARTCRLRRQDRRARARSTSSASPTRRARRREGRGRTPTSSSSARPSAPTRRWARRSGRTSSRAILTDVGSVKQVAIRDLGPHLRRSTCISCPGHPVAGTEHSGPEAGFAELFQGRWCILTPLPRAPTPRRSTKPRGAVAALRHAGRDRWTPTITTRCWPSPRTCRT